MSSILGFSGHSNTNQSIWTKDKILQLASKFEDQGDYQDFYQHQDHKGLLYLVHNRLVTVGLETTTFTKNDNLVVAFDGQIFNYQNFDQLFKKTGSLFKSDTNYEFLLHSYSNFLRVLELGSIPDEFIYDSEEGKLTDEEKTFITLMESLARGDQTLIQIFSSFLQIIQGDFTFVLHDINRQKSWMIRKGNGITPLYYGITQLGEFMIASEKKVLLDDCVLIAPFTPNSFVYENIIAQIPTIIPILPLIWSLNDNVIVSYDDYQFRRHVFDRFNNLEKFLKTSIQVNKLPFGVLFDGSLESQLIIKTISRVMKTESKWGINPHIFSIHLDDSRILDSVQNFLKESGVIHYSFKYTIQKAIEIISKVIYIMETSDMNTLLDAIPQYLLLDKIQKGLHLKYLYSSIGLDSFRYYINHQKLNIEFQSFSEKYSALGNKLPSSFGIQ